MKVEKSKTSSKRLYQEICKQKFNAYLATKLDAKDMSWLDGDEPPDYYLVVKGVKYAVEATTIVLKVPVGQKELELQTIVYSFDDLVKEVEKQACQEGILSGTYFVSFSQPTPNFSKIKKSIKKQILCYLRRTQANDSTSIETIFKNEDLKCFILKKNNISARVKSGLGPAVTIWEPEREACSLLQAIIEKKWHKLSKLQPPKILLLQNTNMSFDTVCYKKCAAKLKLLKHFHTIFIVGFKDENCYILYSENSDW